MNNDKIRMIIGIMQIGRYGSSNMKDPFYKEKAEAYKYIVSKGLISQAELQERKQDFETGDIFWYGVPADPEDGKRAIAGLIARTQTAIEKYNSLGPAENIEPKIIYDTYYSIYGLETLAVILLSLRVPEILGWQVDDGSKVFPAHLLGTIWSKEMEYLPRLIKKIEGTKEANPATIASYLLSLLHEFKSELNELQLKDQAVCQKLYNWAKYKLEWRLQQEKRWESLDEPLPNKKESDDEVLTYSDIIPDPDQDHEISEQADKRPLFNRFGIKKLPHQEKLAVTKFVKGKALNPTERRAKDRGIIKLKKWAKERGLTRS